MEPSSTILQPIEIPTASESFSVYPIVRCVSEIGKLAEPDVNIWFILGYVCHQMYNLIKNKESLILCSIETGDCIFEC